MERFLSLFTKKRKRKVLYRVRGNVPYISLGRHSITAIVIIIPIILVWSNVKSTSDTLKNISSGIQGAFKILFVPEYSYVHSRGFGE
ncbi:uncharacterized protein MONOS_2946 [Monocercomonoides exilis]|uniref:uncharacterized protein n=1 Tax=Monocercomonoides exilis TaxID=2049356 RepID=UPI003559D79E|nr:hypothetical protein MONOS_2946 [Monocercomonoides exilis]|eukprot:MONOS_2946.1-p1 / transcript=MONOS_2946.1 / gene=MONOS_2946 / organism=Monocercomonoides_exilis_PA203 / gene_product=unspecified product / transcript_product=unspecified product / location=Mono_scaffold00064:135185-135534(+) / protein_length=87 / sequence_SO=supercontig / SO=protein_coding / is_pseudo=false